eukprot:TRINITY_DN2460_c0_g2_i1.p2 TRINITY_DN2460_c0_g2~~TRINITY_DN2460_c0_g2_i1.p2  ORF type:complete len:192 (+),score=63.69 TRINITY_DN2460_c0_g2_i1:70-576(+)
MPPPVQLAVLLGCTAAALAAGEPIRQMMTREDPSAIKGTFHFLVELPDSERALVRAEVSYSCLPCGPERPKRLKAGNCWECGKGAGIAATLWPGCDPREHGGQCPGPGEEFAANMTSAVHLAADRPSEWAPADKEAFSVAVRAAVSAVVAEKHGKEFEQQTIGREDEA